MIFTLQFSQASMYRVQFHWWVASTSSFGSWCIHALHLGRDTSFCRADFPMLTSNVYNALCMSMILYIYEIVTSEVKYLCSITPCVFPPLSKNFWLQSFSCNNSQTQLLGFSITHPLCSLLC